MSILVVKTHSFIDVITNSSTELFVGRGKEQQALIEAITEAYPGYLKEYEELRPIDFLTPGKLDIYISYHCSANMWPARKQDYSILPGYTFNELYVPETDYQTGEMEPPAWNGEIQYRLKSNDDTRWGDFVTEENIQEVKDRIDPDRQMYFLFSLDDNPNWEMQERLIKFMTRYHLG